MWWNQKFFVIFGLILINSSGFATSTQFLLNAPRAIYDFVSLASASAAQNASPLSRIVDYRKKEAKVAELQSRKENLEQEDLLLERQQNKPSADNNGGTDYMNEANPSLLQKKINKIITKLRILAQLKNAFSYTPQQYPAEEPSFETSTTQSNVTITFDDPKLPRVDDDGDNTKNTTTTNNTNAEGDKSFNDASVEDNVGNRNDSSVEDSKKIQQNSVEELKHNPKKQTENIHHIYSIARRGKVMEQGPEKINLEVHKPFPNRRSDTVPKHGHKKPLQNILNNQIKNATPSVENTIQSSANGDELTQDGLQNNENTISDSAEVSEQERPSRFGTVGVFFAELFATMVGLAYGAVAQLTSGTATPATL